jgi:hypothetical protein
MLAAMRRATCPAAPQRSPLARLIAPGAGIATSVCVGLPRTAYPFVSVIHGGYPARCRGMHPPGAPSQLVAFEKHRQSAASGVAGSPWVAHQRPRQRALYSARAKTRPGPASMGA